MVTVLETIPDEALTRMVLVTAFTQDEVEAMADVLNGQTLPGRAEPISVAIAGADRSVPAALQAAGTLTHYRNKRFPNGIVLVQLGRSDEAQGIRNLRRINDKSLLDAEGVVLLEMLAQAWHQLPLRRFRKRPTPSGRPSGRSGAS